MLQLIKKLQFDILSYDKHMAEIDVNKIDLSKLSGEMRRYERQWIVISENNAIIASGATYGEAQKKAKEKGVSKTALFRVPPLDYSLAP